MDQNTTSRVTAEKKVPSYFPATSQLLPSYFPDFDVGTSNMCLILRQAPKRALERPHHNQQQLKKLGIIIYYLDQFNHNRSLHTPRAGCQTAVVYYVAPS